MRGQTLPVLTGIRFYAAIFVFLSHVSLLPGGDALTGSSQLFNSGVVGVSFFFVLSGFILTYNYESLFQEKVTGIYYWRFVFDRWSKIYPVHLLALLVILPVAVLSPNLPLDWRAFPTHFLLIQCFLPFSELSLYRYLNVPSWSLSTEWFFYLLAPFAIFLVRRVWGRIALILACATYFLLLWAILRTSSSSYQQLYFVSWFAPSRLVEFLAGVFTAQAFLVSPPPRRVQGAPLWQIVGLTLIVAGAFARPMAPWLLWGGLLYTPGAVLLIWGLAAGQGAVAAHMATPPFHVLGTASFAFYMIHAPMLRVTKGIMMKAGWEIDSWLFFCVVGIGMFFACQITALFICYTYELPVQGWLRRKYRGRFQDKRLFFRASA